MSLNYLLPQHHFFFLKQTSSKTPVEINSPGKNTMASDNAKNYYLATKMLHDSCYVA